MPADLLATAERHMNIGEGVLARMRACAKLISQDENTAIAFRLANLAMETQRIWGTGGSLRWRPFQLGFLLLSLQSSLDGDHEDRETMDLLWFPTGGGETEAYLGLVAAVSFHRRLSLKEPDSYFVGWTRRRGN